MRRLLSLVFYASAHLFVPAALQGSDSSCSDCSTCDICGVIPYPSNTGHVTPDPILTGDEVWSFVSEPTLRPMRVTILSTSPKASKDPVFLAPYAFSEDACVGQQGALILDAAGNPIWFRPTSGPNIMNTDFRVQRWGKKKVLTFWQGTLATPPTYTDAPGGSSEPGSCYYILDRSYRVLKTVSAKLGYTSDIHEFLLTPQKTALLLSTKAVPMDLTPYGGPKDGYVQDFAVQEIDLETDQLLFFWNALDHIPLSDSFEPASSATESSNIWDAYHLNSVGLTDSKEDILVSGRNTWTVYRIHKPTGEFVWQLGGDHSDFTIPEEAQFSWQHDARFLPGNKVSLFDDNCCESADIPPSTPPAHGLVLKLDLKRMTVSVVHTYFHDPNLQVSSQGNVQCLKNGNVFTGWGQSQYYAEFARAGNSVDDPSQNFLYSAQMPGSNYSYRAYRHRWVGEPCTLLSAAVVVSGSGATVYASWNGSTETVSWRVLAGHSPSHLKRVAEAAKLGFETAIPLNSTGPYFQVEALNKKGRVIGKSAVILTP